MRFGAFECKFKPFEWDSKHLTAYSKHSKGIRMQNRTTQMRLEAFEGIFQVIKKGF